MEIKGIKKKFIKKSGSNPKLGLATSIKKGGEKTTKKKCNHYVEEKPEYFFLGKDMARRGEEKMHFNTEFLGREKEHGWECFGWGNLHRESEKRNITKCMARGKREGVVSSISNGQGRPWRRK